MSVLAKFDPIPNTCGLIEAEKSRAADCTIEQLQAANLRAARSPGTHGTADATTFQLTAVSGGLERVLESLVPLTIGITTRHLFLPTTNATWVVYFNNCKMPGSDTNLVPVLSAQLKTRAVLAIRQNETIAKIDDRTWRGFYGSYVFKVYEGSMSPERTVQLSHYEDGWTFEQSGKPYSFERVDRYSERRKRDRFDGGLMEEYLAAFALHPYSDNFYSVDQAHPATLIERIDTDEAIKQRIRFFSLDEAQISRW